ncbi:hypothetical protein PR048_032235 [Dryococelus australis]|uniref:Uncharacterized protein n=1 Tax=Dryococelus australis TaxID=614101 RepID=A0ABQ9G1N1_9NEOP|nr:hypothetical protein PR048_032235 [Dryococelus australis]
MSADFLRPRRMTITLPGLPPPGVIWRRDMDDGHSKRRQGGGCLARNGTILLEDTSRCTVHVAIVRSEVYTTGPPQSTMLRRRRAGGLHSKTKGSPWDSCPKHSLRANQDTLTKLELNKSYVCVPFATWCTRYMTPPEERGPMRDIHTKCMPNHRPLIDFYTIVHMTAESSTEVVELANFSGPLAISKDRRELPISFNKISKDNEGETFGVGAAAGYSLDRSQSAVFRGDSLQAGKPCCGVKFVGVVGGRGIVGSSRAVAHAQRIPPGSAHEGMVDGRIIFLKHSIVCFALCTSHNWDPDQHLSYSERFPLTPHPLLRPKFLPLLHTLNSQLSTTRLPHRRNSFDSRRGRSRIFASQNHAGRCHCLAGFLGDLPFPRPFAPVLRHTHLISPSSALKTSMSRVPSPRNLATESPIERREHCTPVLSPAHSGDSALDERDSVVPNRSRSSRPQAWKNNTDGEAVTHWTRVRENLSSIPGPVVLFTVFRGIPKIAPGEWVPNKGHDRFLPIPSAIPLTCATFTASNDLAVDAYISGRRRRRVLPARTAFELQWRETTTRDEEIRLRILRGLIRGAGLTNPFCVLIQRGVAERGIFQIYSVAALLELCRLCPSDCMTGRGESLNYDRASSRAVGCPGVLSSCTSRQAEGLGGEIVAYDTTPPPTATPPPPPASSSHCELCINVPAARYERGPPAAS